MPPPATASSHVDLGKIMLPKKETPGQTPQSAERINAGLLFEQEQQALEPVAPAPAPVAPAPAPKKEQPLVKPLQTYQGDIESLVGEKQVSVVSIAAAEAERRGTQPLNPEQEAEATEAKYDKLKQLAIIGVSIVLGASALGIGAYIFIRMQPVPLAQQMPAPFAAVDDTQTIEMRDGMTRAELMQTLVDTRNNLSLSLGLVGRLLVAKPGPLQDGTLSEVGAPEFLQTLAPSIPAELVRTLEPRMLFGIHSFDENQAFMILKTDSYDVAYRGMLAWEASMRGDLSPLFQRTPAVRARTTPVAPTPVASSTASSTASTTPATPEPEPAAPFFAGNFIDEIVENHDARVILNQDGDILLLWTFLDRSTIVVTTNAQTLRELISRISQASILTLPAGN